MVRYALRQEGIRFGDDGTIRDEAGPTIAAMRRLAVLVLLLPLACAGTPGPRLEAGVVVAPEPHAAAAGAEILRIGGNAVDAAVAVQFALAVTFPNAGNIGGGGFMLVHTAAGEEAVDYRETGPGAAHRDLFLDARGEVVPRRSLDTALAAGVPGSVAGMALAHERHGRLPWSRLLGPAVRLAEEGWILDAWSARSFAAETRNNAPEYLKGKAGERFVQKELAATLRRIAAEGRDGFYKGETARLIVEQMRRDGGILTAADLEGYRARVRKPLEGSFRGLRVVSMPPPSSGGIALLQLLAMVDPLEPERWSFQGPEHLHHVAELEKRVFADRAEHLGDPDRRRVPVAGLLDPAYLRARAAGLRPDRRTDPAAVAAGVPEPEQTLHFSVVDREGNAVANTTTLNGNYGCGIFVRGAGFLLNNEMDDFSAKPGVPNLFGATGGEANAVGPGKRMLSSMTPTFVFRDGRLWLVLGSPGGTTIFTTVFQVLLNRAAFGLSLDRAVAAPRFHHQWPPRTPGEDPIFVERGIPEAAFPALRALGYAVVPRERLGDVQAVEIDGTAVKGVPDPRGIGVAARE